VEQYFAPKHIYAVLINLIAEKKFNYNLSLNNLELKEAYFVLITTPVKVLNPVYLNSKLDPIKFSKLVFKGKLQVNPDLLPAYDKLLKHIGYRE
jgi:hypothetical protein